jgi:endonuclease VIII
MPEGPEIRRAADKIAAAIVDRPLREVWFAFDHLKPYAPGLTEQKIVAVDTHGKAMLIRFDNGLTIYTHNQLYGIWMVRSVYDSRRQLVNYGWPSIAIVNPLCCTVPLILKFWMQILF